MHSGIIPRQDQILEGAEKPRKTPKDRRPDDEILYIRRKRSDRVSPPVASQGTPRRLSKTRGMLIVKELTMIHDDSEFEELEIIEPAGLFSPRTNSVIYGIVFLLAVANLWLWIGSWFGEFFINAISMFVGIQICDRLGLGDAFDDWKEDALKCLMVSAAALAPALFFGLMLDGFFSSGSYLSTLTFYLAARLAWPKASLPELFLLAMFSGGSALILSQVIGY